MSKVIRGEESDNMSNHKRMTDLITANLTLVNQEKMIRNNSSLVRTLPAMSKTRPLRNSSQDNLNIVQAKVRQDLSPDQ